MQIEVFSLACRLQDVIHQKTRLMFSAKPLLVQLYGPLALIIAALLQSILLYPSLAPFNG